MANRLKMLYNAYPKPDSSPQSIPTPVRAGVDVRTPVTRIHPTKAMHKAATFCRLIVSLNKKKDITVTNAGAVYNSTAATDREVNSMV